MDSEIKKAYQLGKEGKLDLNILIILNKYNI